MVHRNVRRTRDSIVTNLSAPNFEYLLSKHQLHAHYPSLITRIRDGFPIGLNLPTLSTTYLPPNHFKSDEEAMIVQSKVDTEVELGRVLGPFTTSQAFDFLGGHFRTCPLSLVPKDDKVGVGWQMVENFSHKDKEGVSVNSLINSDDFPTTWISAQEFADWVSYIPWPYIPPAHCTQRSSLGLYPALYACASHPSLWLYLALCAPASGCTPRFALQPLAVPCALHSSLWLYPALCAPASGCTLAVAMPGTCFSWLTPTLAGGEGSPGCPSCAD